MHEINWKSNRNQLESNINQIEIKYKSNRHAPNQIEIKQKSHGNATNQI